ncbi:MAG: LacI family DNA-binding transcriptional regulator [Clostridia bacterium]|nr:LacI family DNA-binding transcriptional regulator [Clostridia bacterium]
MLNLGGVVQNVFVFVQNIGVEKLKKIMYNRIGEEKMKKVTIRDIAEKLNISKSSVSLALNDGYGINSETRDKILFEAHQMGYDFSKTKKRHRKVITILIGGSSRINDIFWKEIYLGIESHAMEKKYLVDMVVYDDINNVDEQKKIVNSLLKSSSGGVLIVFDCNELLLNLLDEFNYPLVLVEPQHTYTLNFSQIRGTYYNAGYEIGKYLISKGHKRLAFVGNIDYSINYLLRYNGFRDAIENSGEAELVPLQLKGAEEGSNGDISENAVRELLESKERPTALFIANDVLAQRYIEKIKKWGLEVPKDVSVIGFDNSETSVSGNIHLTTCGMDRRALGRNAVELLFEQINGINTKKTVEMHTKIVERDTVSKL